MSDGEVKGVQVRACVIRLWYKVDDIEEILTGDGEAAELHNKIMQMPGCLGYDDYYKNDEALNKQMFYFFIILNAAVDAIELACKYDVAIKDMNIYKNITFDF